MEKSEVDSIIKDILDTRKGSEKGRKKKTARFFLFISGGESPLEAVQLALGRNEKLQYAQYKALTEIVKFLENFNETKIGECLDSLPSLGRILFQCNLLKVLQRILQLRIPDESICKSVPWKIVYYCGLTVLKAVVDFSRKVDHFTKTLVETDTVELFMEFIDGRNDIMTCFPAVHGLASLCSNSLEARERVIFANGLSKLGQYILKDNCQKMHVKAYKQGLEQYQIDELERLREVYVDTVHFEGTKYVGRHDASYHVIMRWSKKIAEQNDRHRKLVFEDKVISKALVKWIKTPAILQGELEMIDMSLRVISTLCCNHEIARKLVENYNIVKYLEYGVSIPDRDLYLGFTTVSLQLSAVGGTPLEAIRNSKVMA
ncbi:hypothetical protein QZH41_004988 [Actinostola sp. cb2023]|nr:hypothetical protein QZH41_004988 [Actinostola sp. cb2023]